MNCLEIRLIPWMCIKEKEHGMGRGREMIRLKEPMSCPGMAEVTDQNEDRIVYGRVLLFWIKYILISKVNVETFPSHACFTIL